MPRIDTALLTPTSDEVTAYEDSKIPALKAYMTRTGLGLGDAKRALDKAARGQR